MTIYLIIYNFAKRKCNTFFATNMPRFSKVINIVCFLVVFFLLSLPLDAQEISSITMLRTVVIDPGHGGKDPGCISANRKHYEKNITLSVALKLGALIKKEFPSVKVIYTRSTDKYVDLSERAAIANRNKADLFISIHVNATKATQARGTETFVMGTHKNDANFEVCKMENSVITIEDDYEHKYQGFDPSSPESYIIFSLLQNTHLEQSLMFAQQIQTEYKKGPIYVNRGVKQGGLLVLWKTTMPAVLTELGFMSNPKDLSVLVSSHGQNTLANRLFSAFKLFKQEYEEGGVVILEQEGERREDLSGKVQEDVVVEGNIKSGTFFAIQVLSVKKKLPANAPDLKGCTQCKFIKVGNLYKYYIGEYSSKAEAYKDLKQVRKTFPGAFVVQYKN